MLQGSRAVGEVRWVWSESAAYTQGILVRNIWVASDRKPGLEKKCARVCACVCTCVHVCGGMRVCVCMCLHVCWIYWVPKLVSAAVVVSKSSKDWWRLGFALVSFSLFPPLAPPSSVLLPFQFQWKEIFWIFWTVSQSRISLAWMGPLFIPKICFGVQGIENADWPEESTLPKGKWGFVLREGDTVTIKTTHLQYNVILQPPEVSESSS
jgi:hypothetical protein